MFGEGQRRTTDSRGRGTVSCIIGGAVPVRERARRRRNQNVILALGQEPTAVPHLGCGATRQPFDRCLDEVRTVYEISVIGGVVSASGNYTRRARALRNCGCVPHTPEPRDDSETA